MKTKLHKWYSKGLIGSVAPGRSRYTCSQSSGGGKATFSQLSIAVIGGSDPPGALLGAARLRQHTDVLSQTPVNREKRKEPEGLRSRGALCLVPLFGPANKGTRLRDGIPHQLNFAQRLAPKLNHASNTLTGALFTFNSAIAVIVALTLPVPVPVLASENAQPPASLASVVDKAWRLLPQAAGLDARDAEVRANYEMSGGLAPEPPSLSLGNLNDRQGRDVGRQEWEVELAVPLWLPGQKQAHRAEAESRIAEATAIRIAAKLALAGEVRDGWWSLATARSLTALASRRLETARALDEGVKKRFKVGELSRIDANLARGEVLAAETDLIEAQAALLQAEQVFRLLTGIAAPAELVEELKASDRDPLGRTKPTELHPQLAAAAAVARSARARVALAEETRRAAPELALRVVRERDEFAEPYGNNVGIKLKIPFSSSPQVRRDNLAALTEAETADAEMRHAEIQVQQDIERARLALAATEKQLVMSQERRSLSIDNLRLTEKSFNLGETDLATLLRIRAAAIDAEGFYERQRLSHAGAISRLNQALGVLP